MRVVIGEDEALLREGLEFVLGRAGFDVVGVAADAERLVELAREQAPELIVTDIRMPPTNTDDGLRAALAIRACRPETAVLVLSQHVQRAYAQELLEARPAGVGYLLKQRIADVEQFCADARRVASGGTVLDPEVVSMLLTRARRDKSAVDRLTSRQREVLGLVAQGRSNAAIARRLSITEKAVVGHISRVYDELGLPPSDDDHRRVLAVIHYLGPPPGPT
ncbi:MAG: response regulator transcription factor [Geodermatophilaceae bacterium]|nr:response regulator transcription factor [Geodermatophilaceae bacterium]